MAVTAEVDRLRPTLRDILVHRAPVSSCAATHGLALLVCASRSTTRNRPGPSKAKEAKEAELDENGVLRAI